MSNLLRTVFEIRFVTLTTGHTIVVRARSQFWMPPRAYRTLSDSRPK